MYKSLQAGRAISAIFVVLFHLGGAFANTKYFGVAAYGVPFSFGSAGVEFFFVLSGFIIFSAHRKDFFQPHKLANYIKKRVIRIYPTYWIVFLAIFFLAIVSSAFRNSVPHDAIILIKSLLLVPQNGNGIGGAGAPVVAVAWTLQYEMFFYFCFAFLIFNRWLAIILGLTLAYIFIRYTGVESLPFPLWFLSQDYILLFVIGMLVSVICTSKRTSVGWAFLYAIIGAAIFLSVALDTVLGFHGLTGWSTILYGMASSLIVFGVVTAENKGRVLGGQNWLQQLGDSSYALYLIHNPMISVLCKIFLLAHVDKLGPIGALMSFIFIFIICLVSGVLFHLWIEKPIAEFFKTRDKHAS